MNPGEEQLHLTAHWSAEQTEGAPRAAAEEEENPAHDYNGAQRPEDGQHAHTRHGESRGHACGKRHDFDESV